MSSGSLVLTPKRRLHPVLSLTLSVELDGGRRKLCCAMAASAFRHSGHWCRLPADRADPIRL